MTCPAHNLELVPAHGAPVAGGTLMCCPEPSCCYARMPVRTRVVQRKLAIDPGRQQTTVHKREEDVQRAIIQALRLNGYEVLVTSRVRRRVQCAGCGRWAWQQGGDGVTKGTPDLFVYVDSAWRGLEVKGTGTAVSPEQARLAGEGKITIVRSVGEALEAVGASGSLA